MIRISVCHGGESCENLSGIVIYPPSNFDSFGHSIEVLFAQPAGVVQRWRRKDHLPKLLLLEVVGDHGLEPAEASRAMPCSRPEPALLPQIVQATNDLLHG